MDLLGEKPQRFTVLRRDLFTRWGTTKPKIPPRYLQGIPYVAISESVKPAVGPLFLRSLSPCTFGFLFDLAFGKSASASAKNSWIAITGSCHSSRRGCLWKGSTTNFFNRYPGFVRACAMRTPHGTQHRGGIQSTMCLALSPLGSRSVRSVTNHAVEMAT